jgi:hypothetical protein
MKILHLTLTKKWFDRISSGEKLEEYREIKQYWVKRLALCEGKTPVPHGYYCKKANCVSCVTRGEGFRPKHYDIIRFKNGYAKDAPTMDVECKGIRVGGGKSEWGAEMYFDYFVISLGKVLSISNYQTETA